ncbi:MAG: hypothetical protein GY803_29860 [Chloroflexi bacterium]|nr:hypothetical protein [Chloroflexota bacterium]
MDALANEYAQKAIGSIFLYTHEAHPGERYPHLTSMEQKFAHAQALRDKFSVTRPIYLDALDGACHRAYGSMPNMTWIFSRSGIPIYKSDWTDSDSIANAIAYFVDVAKRRRSKARLAPFRVERIDYRVSDREAFFAHLAYNGPTAVREFEEAGF